MIPVLLVRSSVEVFEFEINNASKKEEGTIIGHLVAEL